MSSIQSDNKVHERTCSILESNRQAAVAAANSPAAIKTAEITYYRSIIASCVTNNLPFSNFTQALINLGVTGGA
jgi:hypothetical protein